MGVTRHVKGSQHHLCYLSNDKENKQFEASFAVVLVVPVPIPDVRRSTKRKGGRLKNAFPAFFFVKRYVSGFVGMILHQNRHRGRVTQRVARMSFICGREGRVRREWLEGLGSLTCHSTLFRNRPQLYLTGNSCWSA